jgi:[acyl-carrier-protein] S-malonyltransferase
VDKQFEERGKYSDQGLITLVCNKLNNRGHYMGRKAFLFPGQGSQAVGMGKDFFEASATAREIFHKADMILGYSISHLCFEGPEEELRLTQNTQPALLIVSTIAYSLMGESPFIAAGHSLGEYSALVASGSLSFEDAVLLVHKRGTYMQEAVPVGVGAMAAVLGSPYEDVKKALSDVEEGTVEIANWNSREQIVIAGHERAVKRALSLLKPARSILLPVSAPFHCKLMRSAEEKLAKDLDAVEFKDLTFPIITNVDARIINKGEEARDALKRQVTSSVLWFESMKVMEGQGVTCFVELGWGKVLSGLIKRIGREWSMEPAVMNVQDMESLKNVKKALSN